MRCSSRARDASTGLRCFWRARVTPSGPPCHTVVLAVFPVVGYAGLEAGMAGQEADATVCGSVGYPASTSGFFTA